MHAWQIIDVGQPHERLQSRLQRHQGLSAENGWHPIAGSCNEQAGVVNSQTHPDSHLEVIAHRSTLPEARRARLRTLSRFRSLGLLRVAPAGTTDVTEHIVWIVQRWVPLVRPSGVMTAETPCRLSFEQAYAQHRHQMLRLAVLLTGSREQAEDVVQGVFLTAYSRWGAIEQPLPYLKRAVVNASADSHRRRVRDRTRPTAPEPVTNPEIDETWASLRSLPARQRAVLVLHFYEDLPLVEVADVLNRPAATIRSDLRRALQTLRKDLA